MAAVVTPFKGPSSLRVRATTAGVVWLLLVCVSLAGCRDSEPKAPPPLPAPPPRHLLHCLDGVSGRPCTRYAASAVQIIANPELFDGKTVTTRGFLSLTFEGEGLYLSREDYDWLTGNAISLDLTREQKAEFAALHERYVSVTAVYRARVTEGFVGRMDTVTRVTAAMKRTTLTKPY